MKIVGASTKEIYKSIGSPLKSIFSSRNSVKETNLQVKIQENYFKDKKRKKTTEFMESEKQRNQIHRREKHVNLIFFEKINGKKFIDKSRTVSFKYSETHGKNISAMVTPWSIKDIERKSIEINFILESPRNLFPFTRKPRNWASCTEKPRKLIFSMEILLKPIPSTGIRRKFIFKLE